MRAVSLEGHSNPHLRAWEGERGLGVVEAWIWRGLGQRSDGAVGQGARD